MDVTPSSKGGVFGMIRRPVFTPVSGSIKEEEEHTGSAVGGVSSAQSASELLAASMLALEKEKRKLKDKLAKERTSKVCGYAEGVVWGRVE